jgi:hypothetical protein
MSDLLNHSHFTFNTSGEMESNFKPFQLFIDNNGNIVDRSFIEYGVYNKIINFQFKKLLMIKKNKIGLGDVIDWITTVTKIKNFIIYITKGNCGCEERRIKFNKWFKFYWFSLKFRDIYANDYYIVPKQKIMLKKAVFSNRKKKDNSAAMEMLNFATPSIITPPIKSIDEITKAKQNYLKVKKPCGCGAKKT